MVSLNTSKKVISTVEVVSASLPFSTDINQGIYYRIFFNSMSNLRFLSTMLYAYESKVKNIYENLIIAAHWALLNIKFLIKRNGEITEILNWYKPSDDAPMVVEYCQGLFGFQATFVITDKSVDIHILSEIGKPLLLSLLFTDYFDHNGQLNQIPQLLKHIQTRIKSFRRQNGFN